MFFDEIDPSVAVRQAVLELDPSGKLIRGENASVYDAVIDELIERVQAGELLMPDLVARIFFKHRLPIDIEDVRELARRIGVKLGFA